MLQTKDKNASDATDTRRELVQRIAASPQFRKSPRMREFLFFITERTLQGQADELTEHNIGCGVFGRTDGYDPTEDNIVRVSARQLRSKLKEYCQAEGETEPLLLEIPRGAYVPVFKPSGKPEDHVPPVAPNARLPFWITVGALVFAGVAMAAAGWFWHENRTLTAAL